MKVVVQWVIADTASTEHKVELLSCDRDEANCWHIIDIRNLGEEVI